MTAPALPWPWRRAEALALEARVLTLEDWIDASEDLLELLEHAGELELARELRPAIAAVRSKRNDYRAAGAELEPDGAPPAGRTSVEELGRRG